MLISLLIFLVCYVVFVFFALQLFVPYMKFYLVEDMPKDIPQDFLEEIERLNKKSMSNKEFLRLAYASLTKKFYGSRLKTIFLGWYAFQPIFTHPQGFLHCNVENELLRVMLIKSGRFKKEDITRKITFVNFFIHQYLQVKVDDEVIDVDLWGHVFGIPFGKHSFLFV